MGDPESATGLVTQLSGQGLRVVRRAAAAVYWDGLGAHPDHSAVFFVREADRAHDVMQRLSARWGARRPLVIAVGPMLTALDVDGLLTHPEDSNAIHSLANLIRRLGHQQAELQRLRGAEDSIRAAVEHDLYAPLVAIAELASSLTGEMLSANARLDVQGLVQTVRSCQKRLAEVRPAGKANVEHETPAVATSLRGLIADAVQSTGYTVNIVEWVPEAADPIVMVQPSQFRRVVEHLLVNTRQHANGTAAIRIGTEYGNVLVEVADRGPGIRGKSPLSTGGLAYCRAVLAAHSGDLTILDRPGGGVLIRAVWPGLVDSRRIGTAVAKPSESEQPALIWFADDENLVRKAVTRLLGRAGFRTRTFENGDDMLHMAEHGNEEKPDLVICDADMPGTQGLEVLRRMQTKLPHASRVLYTAYQPTGLVIEAFNQGVVHRFINKGNGAAHIESCVKALVSTSKPTKKEEKRDEVREALEDLLQTGAVELYLQPLYDAESREMVACEALLRSLHPHFKGPADILDATRAYARELPLQRLLSTIGRGIREQLPNHIELFMNVDPIILANPDQLDVAFSPLYPVANLVVLELTERAQLDSEGSWEKSVEALRRHGFRIALDDVGAGYNSLAALAAVTPDVMKLDISLISNLHRDSQKAALVRLLCDFANQHSIRTVAEGIEAEAEAARCQELGATWLQGFHLARPMPANRLLEQVRPANRKLA